MCTSGNDVEKFNTCVLIIKHDLVRLIVTVALISYDMYNHCKVSERLQRSRVTRMNQLGVSMTSGCWTHAVYGYVFA